MIQSVFDRLDWADEHIKNLVDQTNAFLNSKPYALVSEVDEQSGDHFIRFAVAKSDSGLALRLTDCIHHLRATLDNLAWHLALLNTPIPYERTQFPIVDGPEAFKSEGLRQIQSIDPSIGTFIEEEQPYNRTPSHPRSDRLWTIHSLSNIDKHRRLHVVGGAPKAGLIRLFPPQDCEFLGPFAMPKEILGAYEDGAEITRTPVRITGPNPEVPMYANVVYDVFVNEKGPPYASPAWEMIQDLRDRVRGIAVAFSRFF